MVDKFINYSDDKDTLNEAFGFVMDYVDQFKSPNIVITAYEVYHDVMEMDDDTKGELKYGVSVSGNVE